MIRRLGLRLADVALLVLVGAVAAFTALLWGASPRLMIAAGVGVPVAIVVGVEIWVHISGRLDERDGR